jgi:hypothetical protein
MVARRDPQRHPAARRQRYRVRSAAQMLARCLMLSVPLLLAGCLIGPQYQRPDYPVPPAFRGEAPEVSEDVMPLGDLSWWQLFQDDQLPLQRHLISCTLLVLAFVELIHLGSPLTFSDCCGIHVPRLLAAPAKFETE